MHGEIERRVFLGRLLERLRQIEESARAAVWLVQNEVRRIDANRTEPLPATREMIVSVIKAAGNVGLARAEIITAIDRDYGLDVSPDTVTTTLLRMQKAGLVSRHGLLWSLR
jgi:DNA-binding CsgD family transcriptional regulator